MFLYRTHTNVNDYFPFKYLQFKNQNIAITRTICHLRFNRVKLLAWLGNMFKDFRDSPFKKVIATMATSLRRKIYRI